MEISQNKAKKIYSVNFKPILIYNAKAQILTNRNKSKTQAMDMNFLKILREDQKDTDSEMNFFTKEDGIQNLLIKLDEQLQWLAI